MTALSLIDPFRLKLWVFRADDGRVTGVHAALAAMHEKARRTRSGRFYVNGIKAFGVSHTMNWTAYLLATRKYVGVDLEMWDRPDLAGLERRLGPVITSGDSVQVGFLTSWCHFPKPTAGSAFDP